MYDLYAKFPQQQISKDRQYSALLRWAAYIDAAGPPVPFPEVPDTLWVKQKIVAERIPPSTNTYVELTMPGTLQDPAIQTNIRDHMHPFATDGAKASLDVQVDAALSAYMPKFAQARITQAEADMWLKENGYETTTP